MTGWTEATHEKVRGLFPQEQYSEVVQLLETERGNNLPFLQRESAKSWNAFGSLHSS